MNGVNGSEESKDTQDTLRTAAAAGLADAEVTGFSTSALASPHRSTTGR